MKYGLATGNWGIKSNNTKVGIAQVLNRLTYTSTLSHLRRVNTPTEKTGKLVAPRKLHNTQWGIICPTETPEGGSVGLVKNLAVTTYVTNQSSPDIVFKLIQESEWTDPVDLTNLDGLYKKTKIFVNGIFEWTCNNVSKFYKYMISNKRKGVLNIYTSVSFNPDLNEINIYTDSGRCCRPLYIVDEDGLRISKKDLQMVKNGKLNWLNLIIRNIIPNSFDVEEASKQTSIEEGVIEYIDTEESESRLIAMNYSDIKKKKGFSQQLTQSLLQLKVCII